MDPKLEHQWNKEECLPEEKRRAAEEGNKAPGGYPCFAGRNETNSERDSAVDSHERGRRRAAAFSSEMVVAVVRPAGRRKGSHGAKVFFRIMLGFSLSRFGKESRPNLIPKAPCTTLVHIHINPSMFQCLA